ncbi:MAG: alanine dehydrogenase [Microbacteriaceae bacterium]|nr:alanine dehydrogenase [Microbacteriaceae bacterium]MCL2795484.1 alanine dehydrogenase [Microbacteriaceae bacterium]
MRIAVPREVKDDEYRVALTPAGVHALVGAGHSVVVETGAGLGSAIGDDEYAAAGASLEPDAAAVWADAELVLKVKEPIPAEFGFFRDGLVLFTYLHLAANRPLTEALVASRVTAIAYETVQLPDRRLPLLAPMSEVAGRLAPIVGASTLMRPAGGPGILISGVPGTRHADVVVIGGGVAGSHAVTTAVGLGARVTVLDTDLEKLRHLDELYQGRVTALASNPFEIERALVAADLVIGSVLIPGARAPKLVTDELVARMRPGSVLVDIAIDQGGCFEGSRPTTHHAPTFPVHGSLFYCVANMPGAVAQTSTHALANATLRYIAAIADRGWREALAADPALALGLNVHAGEVVSEPVAAAHGMPAGRFMPR